MININDEVRFVFPGLSYIYRVKDGYLGRNDGNSLIFLKLSLNSVDFCTKAYGYPPLSGIWPKTKPGDFEALARCVTVLAEKVAEKEGSTFINGTVFTNDYIDKMNLAKKLRDKLFLKKIRKPISKTKIRLLAKELSTTPKQALVTQVLKAEVSVKAVDADKERFKQQVKDSKLAYKKRKANEIKKLSRIKKELSSFSPDKSLKRFMSLPIQSIIKKDGKTGIITEPLSIDLVEMYDTSHFSEYHIKNANMVEGKKIGSFFIGINERYFARVSSLEFATDHPFISTSGSLCCGNMGRRMDAARARKSIIDISEIVIELLVTPFAEGGYRSWHSWFEQIKKRTDEQVCRILKFEGV